MIDVIIPAYNAHNTIGMALESVEKQTIKNKLKVYIIDDCSKEPYDYLKNKYDLDITIYRLDENGGPGVARQYGIEHSSSEYIVFIDADDIFSNNDSVETMYRTIKGCDVGVTAFMEEYEVGGYTIYDDNIWMHGKIYRRKYLIDNNIYFNGSRQNEDYAFNRLIVLSGAKIKCSDKLTYIWKYNKDSITRKNDYEFSYTGLFSSMDNTIWILEESIKRKYSPFMIGSLAYETLVFMYVKYLRYYDTKDMSELLRKCKKVLDIYNKYKLTSKQEELIYNKTYYKYFNIYIKDIVIDFNDFLNIVNS